MFPFFGGFRKTDAISAAVRTRQKQPDRQRISDPGARVIEP
jgi:hypothetical protein